MLGKDRVLKILLTKKKKKKEYIEDFGKENKEHSWLSTQKREKVT